MIITDENAENKLVKVLEALRTQPDNSRCIYFRFSKIPLKSEGAETICQTLLTIAKRNNVTPSLHLYQCADDDIFMIAPVMNTANAQQFITETGNYFHLEETNKIITFHDLRVDANRLLVVLEQKIEHRKKTRENLLKQQQEALQKRKRELILNSGAQETNPQSFRERRSFREKPELMIIEDDAFTRRLVENVLQHYHITALGVANTALSTYARIAPNMVFLDINLPDVSGHDLLERIMTIDPEAYVVMLSGNADKANILQAMSKGAKGFVAKPFTREKLLQYIERCPTISMN